MLIALYSVRSDRQFCERLQYDLLFRFFLDLILDERAFDATSFAKEQGAATGSRCRRSGRAAGW
jgi:transposase